MEIVQLFGVKSEGRSGSRKKDTDWQQKRQQAEA